MKSGALWVHCWWLALADFGHDPRSSDSERQAKFFFCLVNNAQFHHFLLDKFHKICTQQCQSVRRWKLSEQNFENFTVRSCLKNANISHKIPTLRLQATIIVQWLQITWNSLTNDPSAGCLVSIFIDRINSKSFPWAVHSIQENYLPKCSAVSDVWYWVSQLCCCVLADQHGRKAGLDWKL